MFNRASPLLVVLLLGCEGQITEPPVSFSRDVEPIFQGNCMPCHWSPMIVDVSKVSKMVDVDSTWDGARHKKLIVAGKPEESFLYDKLTATDLTDHEGSHMPPAADTVSATELATIRQWISDGATESDPNFGPVSPRDFTKVRYIFGISVNLGPSLGKCSLCHGPGTSNGPDLAHPFDPVTGAVNITASNGQTMIIPGDPDNSLLVKKLTDPVPAGAGRSMPLKAPPLTDEQIELVQRWILEGAQDN
jgi:mono/diheme cytochrome c family protein